jgi:hypothetical protein
MNPKHVLPPLCLLLLTLLAPCTPAAEAAIKLSPTGEKLLAAKDAEYPPFDADKVRHEAETLYPVIEVGDEVSILRRGRKVKGAFRSIDAKYLRIGDTNVPLIDLEPDVIARFSPDGVRQQRERHVSREQSRYEFDRERVQAEISKGLAKKYPALPESLVESLFEKLPADRREAYTQEFLALYDSRLPLTIDPKQFVRATFDAFLAMHRELIRVDNHLWDRDQFEAFQKRHAELVAARAERRQERILRPQAATPVIEPDEGMFVPGLSLTLSSSTPGAKIHYTLDGSEPNEDSPLYTTSITLKDKVPVKAIALHPEFNDSDTMASAPWSMPWVPGGLLGSYFGRITFKGKTGTRTDPTVNFTFNNDPHYPGMPTDYISVIWTGRLKPPRTGQYTFHLFGDNGFRFWLDDKLLMNFWLENVRTDTAVVNLVAGRTYDVKICLWESWGVMGVKWEWEGPQIPRQVVPKEVLCPTGKYSQELQLWNIRANRTKMPNPAAVNGSYRMSIPGGTNPGQKQTINWGELDVDN